MVLDDLRLGYHGGPDVVSTARETIRSGELLCLVGPNGGGKTTLLRAAAGLLHPRGGTVLLNERPLYGAGAWHRDDRARQVAVVLTDRITPAYLRVRELVSLGRIPHRNGGDHDAVIKRALRSTGVRNLAERHAGQLSDGEQRRVVIARALAQEPQLLLLDEPTAHLDPPHQTDLFMLLRRLVEEGTIHSAVIATHQLHLALHFAHRMFLVSGTVLASGSPGELLESGAVSAAFPDTPGVRLDSQRGWYVPSEDGP